MKIKFLLLTFLSVCLAQLVSAQIIQSRVTLKGIVVDSASQKVQDYVTISLKKVDKPFKSALTDDKGSFSFENLSSGKYTITVVAVGFNSKNIPLELNDSLQKNINLGRIAISASNTTLKEISIVADRPLIKQEIDRISYDVQADPESKVNNVLDMLRKVPLISVDADDNIKLKGSGS